MTTRCYPIRLVIAILASSLLCATAYADDQRELNLEQQPLADALKSVANEFDLEIAFFSDTTDGIEAIPLAGNYTQDQAFDALLDDTSLEHEQLDNGTVVVRAKDQRGASDSKNLKPQPILMAQNQTSQQQTTSSRSEEGGTSIVTGKVTDARTGANLKGAKVTIEETGQWTSTNDLGEFRLVNVPTGSATLMVSYLGYASQSAVVGVREDGASQNFALRGGSQMEEIVVFGQRSARALALNQERTANNFSTVISADLLGQFNGTTISEALRRAPGVAFVPNPENGDGANIIVRGLEPDLNQITLNGLRLPEGSGTGRAPDLGGLLTESIESVTIHKTLLPSQDSNGVGGLVEIETKSPLDRQKRFAHLGVEYGERGGDFGEDMLLSGTASGRFGSDERFGASVSLQYRKREVTNLNYSAAGFSAGQFLPADFSNAFDFDPRTPFPFEQGIDEVYPQLVNTGSSVINDENLSLTTSFQKQIADHTDLRFDITNTTIESEAYSTNTNSFNSFAGYVLLPVDELNGEERLAYISEDFFLNAFGIPLFPGVNLGIDRSATWSPGSESKTSTYSFRGTTERDQWTFNYQAGFSDGSTATPATYNTVGGADSRGPMLDLAFLTDEARNNTINGLLVSPFAPLVPGSEDFIFPALNEAGFSYYNQIDNVPFGRTIASFGGRGSNERLSLQGSVRRDLNHDWLKYIEVGVFFEDAEFESLLFRNSDLYSAASGITPSQLGLAYGPGLLTRIGVPNDFLALDRGSVEQFFLGASDLAAAGLLNIDAGTDQTEQRTVKTVEENLSGYIQSRINIGKLEVIGGFRVDSTNVDSSFFVSPFLRNADGTSDPTYRDTYGEVVSGSAEQTDILPRIIANYRWSENVVFRGGYFSTASRPQVRNLNRGRGSASLDLRPQFGPNGDQPRLFLTQGNPDLKPAITHNFDASWEWYNDTLGVIKVSGFYKETENALTSTFDDGGIEIIPDAIVLPDAPGFDALPDNVFVSITTPINGDENDKIWGAELAIERQFDFLPGIWSGFGFYGNYTHADSARNVELFNGATSETFILEDVPFTGSPKHSGTLSLTYNKYGIDANLTYSEQVRRLSSLVQNGLDLYAEAVQTLDFRIEYLAEIGGANVRFHVSGRDLLTGEDETYLQNSIGGENGVPKYFTGGSYFGGRSFTLGVSTTFQ